MKFRGPLSAACASVALSPSAVVDAFAPSAAVSRRNRRSANKNFPAIFPNSGGVVSRPTDTTFVPPAAAGQLSAATMGTELDPTIEPHSPAQRRAAAESASQSRYHRSNYSPAAWAQFTRTDPILSAIRSDLVTKFVALGRTPSDAESEVDAFLDDEDRSGEFVEMRRYAAVHKEDGMGFEDALLYLGAFCVGVGADLALRLAAEYMDGVSVPFFS
mmetsp:Transcript_9358/g.20052  ORF Transcript_9358/g.20052 Transcript_9358/m.20052 type:complete len:216 (-) Transcript_9358:207-854(-)|eukprot:CAMPEP_0178483182 /NCGR_PEP_ID=MMETSP0696-20121128/7102_1 /TAXON_ID=265572 /ORGANISM="Extubocellulus spinifer, Strain CCMP396" /LENGTH=215 /DNA_ID=CAMNT_0020110691 /DNA_START=49 /DNA_END=696 /DNA_ORIENTATION=+